MPVDFRTKLTPDLAEELAKQAREEGVQASELAVDAIQPHVEAHKSQQLSGKKALVTEPADQRTVAEAREFPIRQILSTAR